MCPFVDKTDVRCSAHLTFRNLFSAFERCAGEFAFCKVYQELLQEKAPCGEYENVRAPGSILFAS
jgi:hypothetical protein